MNEQTNMKVVVIDDEDRARKSIVDILQYSDHPVEVVAEANGVKKGLEVIREKSPDIVLLDINMPDGTGFDLLKSLDTIDFKIIFITAYEEFAIRAFEFSAIDYLLKPIDPEKLIEALNKAFRMVEYEKISVKLNALFTNLDNQESRNKKLVLKTSDTIHLIDTSEIIRCESDGGYTFFFLAEGKKIMVSRNMKDYEEMLKDYAFYRIHQSHLINLKFIDSYLKTEGGAVIMKDGSTLPLARRKKESFLKLIEMI